MRMTRMMLVVGGLIAASTLVVAMVGQNSPAVDQKLNNVRAELESVKSELGEMNCCIKPSCNFCPMAAGMCTCAHGLTTKSGVCGECYDGWRAGAGHIDGVDPKNVPSLPDDMVRKMYQMKAEHFTQ